MEKATFAGWGNCYRLSNGIFDLVVTSDIGPRIIRFGFINWENEFKEFSEQLGQQGGSEWLSYGGHRLWAAPEDKVMTYYPDNGRVRVEEVEDGLCFTANVEASMLIQKTMIVRIVGDAVVVDHKIVNKGDKPVDMSAWALTVMAPGGTAIVPLPERGPHPLNLTPASRLILWKYTNLKDARWIFGERYILAKQDEKQKRPQKLGFLAPDGWLAYANHGNLFIKKIRYMGDVNYPDMGSNLEVFFDDQILELETLSPLKHVLPGDYVAHQELWRLVEDVEVNEMTIDNVILPIVDSMKFK